VTRFALVVPFPDLAPVVDDVRERTCLSKPSHGVPPHVTLVVPCTGDVPAIAEQLAPFGPFEVSFAAFGRFPDVLWLAPDPPEPFHEMTAALVACFPDHRPYGGMFSEVVPHLTVAQADLDAAVAELEPRLPVRSRATCAVLLEQEHAARWNVLATFSLGAG
jgi:2'-5' RNA ligase